MGYEQIAAVDLGSNSFRLQIGRVVGDQDYPLDTLKEPVRLASGLSREKWLDDASQVRALEALQRFAERLRGFQPEAVRAVATNTLRIAKNAPTFLPQAEAALGFPIEVIAGREEARLIYVGAAHDLPPARHKRLVVDIGGGSTEFIIGKKLDPVLLESLFMGCVSYSLRFFTDGKVDKKRFQEAEIAAAREISTIAREYRRAGWIEAVATSGTARAIADLLECNGLNPDGQSGISREGLARLRALIVRAGSASALKVAGLRLDRVPVLPGGIAIMSAVFDELGVDHLTYSEGALRLGCGRRCGRGGRGGIEGVAQAEHQGVVVGIRLDRAARDGGTRRGVVVADLQPGLQRAEEAVFRRQRQAGGEGEREGEAGNALVGEAAIAVVHGHAQRAVLAVSAHAGPIGHDVAGADVLAPDHHVAQRLGPRRFQTRLEPFFDPGQVREPAQMRARRRQ